MFVFLFFLAGLLKGAENDPVATMLFCPVKAEVQEQWERHLYLQACKNLMFARNFGRALDKGFLVRNLRNAEPFVFDRYFPDRTMSDIFMSEFVYTSALKCLKKNGVKVGKEEVYEVLKQAVLCAHTKQIEKGSVLESAAVRWGHKGDLRRYEGVRRERIVQEFIRRGLEELVEENIKILPFLKEASAATLASFGDRFKVLILDGDLFLGELDLRKKKPARFLYSTVSVSEIEKMKMVWEKHSMNYACLSCLEFAEKYGCFEEVELLVKTLKSFFGGQRVTLLERVAFAKCKEIESHIQTLKQQEGEDLSQISLFSLYEYFSKLHMQMVRLNKLKWNPSDINLLFPYGLEEDILMSIFEEYLQNEADGRGQEFCEEFLNVFEKFLYDKKLDSEKFKEIYLLSGYFMPINLYNKCWAILKEHGVYFEPEYQSLLEEFFECCRSQEDVANSFSEISLHLSAFCDHLREEAGVVEVLGQEGEVLARLTPESWLGFSERDS